MILIAILLGLIVLLFGKQNRTHSCNISDFLQKRRGMGNCPPDGNLKSSNFCKVPCDNGDNGDNGDITISCSSDGKTGVVRRCDTS